ncbi:SphA family protein [Aromatoleum sp.]|uniref:SphA family protein n=1 Tax=Aromatoleum sp. TaxID=2307007 RepID=UPI002FC88C2F
MKIRQLSIAVALATAVVGNATAKEGGDQYPNGAENWLAGAVPPPGNYFLNYFGYYDAKLRDGDGDKVPGTSVRAWFDALRFIKMTNTKILGGDWGMHLIVPFVSQDVKLGGPGASASGVGDITINPIIVAWHTPNLHWTVALDFNLPTGKYESGDPRKSIGTNYWSIEPIFAVTWLSDSGWELSGKFMYNIKRKNEDFRPAPGAPKMDYDSGDDFHMDYVAGKHFGPWAVGLSGYYLKQTTDDELEGETLAAVPGLWSRGRKGEVFAIGPSVSYTAKSGTMFIAQWQRETSAENRFRGDKAWFKLVLPF